jgi:hypothetical protein
MAIKGGFDANDIAAQILSALDAVEDTGVKKAEDIGISIGQAVRDGIVEGSKGLESEIGKTYRQFLNFVRSINRSADGLKLDKWKKGLGLAQSLMEDEKYAHRVADALKGVQAVFNGTKVSGLENVLREFAKSSKALQNVSVPQAKSGSIPTKKKPKVEAPVVQADPAPVVKVGDVLKATEVTKKQTEALREQEKATEKYIKAQEKIAEVQAALKSGSERGSFGRGKVYSGREGRLTLARRIGSDLSQFDLSNYEIDKLIDSTYDQFSKVRNLIVDKQTWDNEIRGTLRESSFSKEFNKVFPADTLNQLRDLDKTDELEKIFGRVRNGIISVSEAIQLTSDLVNRTIKPQQEVTQSLREQESAAEGAAKAQKELNDAQQAGSSKKSLEDEFNNQLKALHGWRDLAEKVKEQIRNSDASNTRQVRKNVLSALNGVPDDVAALIGDGFVTGLKNGFKGVKTQDILDMIHPIVNEAGKGTFMGAPITEMFELLDSVDLKHFNIDDIMAQTEHQRPYMFQPLLEILQKIADARKEDADATDRQAAAQEKLNKATRQYDLSDEEITHALDVKAKYTGANLKGKSDFISAIKDEWGRGNKSVAAKLFEQYKIRFPGGTYSPSADSAFGTDWVENYSKYLEQANRHVAELDKRLDGVVGGVIEVQGEFKKLNDIIEQSKNETLAGIDLNNGGFLHTDKYDYTDSDIADMEAHIDSVRKEAERLKDEALAAKQAFDEVSNIRSEYFGVSLRRKTGWNNKTKSQYDAGKKSEWQAAIKSAWDDGNKPLAAKLYEQYQVHFPKGTFDPSKQAKFGEDWVNNYEKYLEQANRHIVELDTMLRNMGASYGKYMAYFSLDGFTTINSQRLEEIKRNKLVGDVVRGDLDVRNDAAKNKYATNDPVVAQENLNKAIAEYNRRQEIANGLLKHRDEMIDAIDDDSKAYLFDGYVDPATAIHNASGKYSDARLDADRFAITELEEAVRVARELGVEIDEAYAIPDARRSEIVNELLMRQRRFAMNNDKAGTPEKSQEIWDAQIAQQNEYQKELAETADAVKQVSSTQKNLLYHAGDLSNPSKTKKSFPLGNVNPSQSSMVFNGLTGLYTTEDIEQFWGTEWQYAPLSVIDASQYKLFDARTDELASKVNAFFNNLNGTIYGYTESFDTDDVKKITDVKTVEQLYDEFKEVFKDIQMDFETFKSFVERSRAIVAGHDFADATMPAIDEGIAKSGVERALQGVSEEVFNSDSFQTQLMRMLGFEGIDLRGTKYNGTYSGGTVLFDVKPESIKTVNAKFTDVMSGRGHTFTEEDLQREEKRRQLAFDTAKAYSEQADAQREINSVSRSAESSSQKDEQLSSVVADKKTIGQQLLEIENITGMTVTEVLSDYDNLDKGIRAKVSSILQSLGLMNEQMEFAFSKSRGGNAKAILGDGFVILQKAIESNEEYADSLIAKLQEAQKLGINVAPIMERVFSNVPDGSGFLSNNLYKPGYEIQERASGKDIHINQRAAGARDLNKALEENRVILSATDEQLVKFIHDYIQLDQLGVKIDHNPFNFLYDAEKGFSFIDLSLKRTEEQAKSAQEVFRELSTVLANTVCFNALGQDSELGLSSGQVIAKVADAFEKSGLATRSELDQWVQDRYEGFGNIYAGYTGKAPNIQQVAESAEQAKKSLQDVLNLIGKMSSASGDSDAFNKRHKALIDKANDLTSGADYDQVYDQLIKNESRYQQELKKREVQAELYAEAAINLLSDGYDSVPVKDQERLFSQFSDKVIDGSMSASDAMDQLYLSMEALRKQSEAMPESVAQGWETEFQKLETHVNNLGEEFKNSEYYRDSFSMLVDGIKSGSITASQAMEKMSDAYEKWSNSLVGENSERVQEAFDIQVDRSNPLVANAFRGMGIKDWIKDMVQPNARDQLEDELYKLAQTVVNNDNSAFGAQFDHIVNFIVDKYKVREQKEADAYEDLFKNLVVVYSDEDVASMGSQLWENAKSILGRRLQKRTEKNKHYNAIDQLVDTLAQDHPELFKDPNGNESEYNKLEQLLEHYDVWKQNSKRKTVDHTLSDADRPYISEMVSDILPQMITNIDKAASRLENEQLGFDGVAQSAERAAKAKEKFNKANKNVKQGADQSSDSLDDEAESMDDVNRAAANMPDVFAYDSTTVRMDADGRPYSVSGTSRNEMIDGTHVRTTDTYQFDADNNRWDYIGSVQSSERTREMVQALEEYYRISNKIQKLRLDTSSAIHTEEINKLETEDLLRAQQRLLALGVEVNDIEGQINLSVNQRRALLDVELRARQEMYDVIAKMEDKQATVSAKPYQKTVRDELKKSADIDTNVRLLGDNGVSDRLQAQIADYRRLVDELVEMRLQLARNPDLANDVDFSNRFAETAKRAKNARIEIEGVFKESQKLQKIGALITTGDKDVSRVENLKVAMMEFANATWDGEAKITGFNKEGNELYVTLDRGAGAVENITVALHRASGRLQAFSTGTSKATNEWEDFKTQAVAGAKNLIGMYVGFQEGVQAVRSGINYVKEIDLAMTELKKVTDETDVSYKQFLEDASSTSAVIGSTISDFTEATATFARLGSVI